MKRNWLALFCTALLLCACGESQTQVDAEVFKTANTVESKVEGMDCGGCESSICFAVQDVPGVAAVKADHDNGTVTIALDADADAAATQAEVEKVIVALSNGKFTVVDGQPDNTDQID
ncbi:MAG: heavy-metal-associated domain-containing protein [Planctomycetota bacterium]